MLMSVYGCKGRKIKQRSTHHTGGWIIRLRARRFCRPVAGELARELAATGVLAEGNILFSFSLRAIRSRYDSA